MSGQGVPPATSAKSTAPSTTASKVNLAFTGLSFRRLPEQPGRARHLIQKPSVVAVCCCARAKLQTTWHLWWRASSDRRVPDHLCRTPRRRPSARGGLLGERQRGHV